jgi:small subunit ribosomal protein S9
VPELPIRKHEEDTVAEPTNAQVPAAAAGAEPEQTAGEHVSQYTTQTGDTAAGSSAKPAARKPVVTGNALGTGRRKQAIARVRIMPGTGKYRINDRSLDEYFPNKVHQQLINEPFATLGADDQFDVVARLSGGGVTGQAGALRLGIARSLVLVDQDNRPALKRAGFLTRDPRAIERKKAGRKKARKAPQYSKR